MSRTSIIIEELQAKIAALERAAEASAAASTEARNIAKRVAADAEEGAEAADEASRAEGLALMRRNNARPTRRAKRGTEAYRAAQREAARRGFNMPD